MRWIALGIALPLIVASSVAADEVAPPRLVVRSGPGGHYRQVGALKRGAPVRVIGKASRGYLPVSFTGGRGWVPQQFIRRSNQSRSGQPGPLGTNPFAPTAPNQGLPSNMTSPGLMGSGANPAAPRALPAPAEPSRASSVPQSRLRLPASVQPLGQVGTARPMPQPVGQSIRPLPGPTRPGTRFSMPSSPIPARPAKWTSSLRPRICPKEGSEIPP